MIAGLDSAFPPSPDAALAAKAAGVRLWSGYLSSAPYDGWSHFGLYHPWPPEGFEYARLCGSTPIAFCSGWDSPGALKALAEGWNLRLCLDVESGIRPDGPWVQSWLDASGAGLYGNAPVHRGRRAAFYILAAYPGIGDPAGTWNLTPRPSGPCAWQWIGTHTEFGVGVDRGDYDDWFGGLHGGGSGGLEEEEMDTYFRIPDDQPNGGAIYNVGPTGKRHVGPLEWGALASVGRTAASTGDTAAKTAAFLAEIPDATTAGGSVDLKPVLDAIAALKFPTTITGKLT